VLVGSPCHGPTETPRLTEIKKKKTDSGVNDWLVPENENPCFFPVSRGLFDNCHIPPLSPHPLVLKTLQLSSVFSAALFCEGRCDLLLLPPGK
jgi:hypothetical protein